MRLTFAAVAWLALAAASFFLFHSEQRLQERRAAVRAFDLHAHDAAGAIADIRSAQQAYVAAGQGTAFWMPKVSSTLDRASSLVSGLAQEATGAASRNAIEEASKGLSDFAGVDKRVRDYLSAGQSLMAADVIFTEGAPTLAAAARQVDAARLAEREEQDGTETATRQLEAGAAGGAAILAALTLLALALRPKRSPLPIVETLDAQLPAASGPQRDELLLKPADARAAEAPPAPAAASVAQEAAAAPPPAHSIPLDTAAAVCADLSRVRDSTELTPLLGRAADVLEAKGLIVWLGTAAGDTLAPVLAHGYPEQVLARMGALARTANNPTAQAYRTGELQVVAARDGVPGALVAPLFSQDGCIGALSLERRDASAIPDDARAMATILAAQLAAIVAPARAGAEERTDSPAARSSYS